MAELKRRGDKAKCPACGWGLDEDAYRCPKCRIYFCYKCRARVGKQDEQHQCADQSCSCYGKLLCSACTVIVDQTGQVKSFNIDENVWKGLLILAGICGVGAWAKESFAVGAAWAIGIFVVGAVLFLLLNSLYHRGPLGAHRCCIQCRHPVKNLR